MTSIASFSDTFVLFVCFVVHRLPRPSSAPRPWLLSVARPEATRSTCSRRTRCPSYKEDAATSRPTQADIHSPHVRRTSCPSKLCRVRIPPRPARSDFPPETSRLDRRRKRRRKRRRTLDGRSTCSRRTRCPSYKEAVRQASRSRIEGDSLVRRTSCPSKHCRTSAEMEATIIRS
jgi:hypothetical protein